MTRVYWRIFLAFWLVLIMTVVVTAAVNTVMFRDEVSSIRVDTLHGSLNALAEQAERRLQQDGPTGLQEWLREQQRESPQLPLLIVAKDGREILNRPTPPGARMFLKFESGDRDAGDYRSRIIKPFGRGVRRLEDANGNAYVMMIPRFERGAGRWFAAPRVRAVFPVVLVLISGLVCLLLARYLTRPIAAFRQAGQRIAAGELNARVGNDIAHRKDEFGALARDFDNMAGRVEQLIGTQQRLLRDVSHELRSPLARLQAAAGLIRQRGGDDANLDRIEREIGVLDNLIGQILGYSRIQSRTSLNAQRIDVNELVSGVVEDACFEGAAGDRRVRFEPGAPVFATVDADLLRSAVENVVRNALQYSVATTEVFVAGDEASGRVEICVHDDGEGVAEDVLAQLFDPFFTGASPHAGAGIGLAIARRVVELHGGTIVARNAAGGGLVVSMSLPVACR